MNNEMKRSACLVFALLISGCSGAAVPPASSTGATVFEPNSSGGSFAANSDGGYHFLDCGGTNGHFKFSGTGHASFLHRITESGHMKGKIAPPHCVWNGTATLTSRHRPKDSVTFTLGLNGSRYHNPCTNAVGYVVKRGTGKFANASGYGTVTFSCTDSGIYLDDWSGTLNF